MENNNKVIIWSIIGLLVVAGVVVYLLRSPQPTEEPTDTDTTTMTTPTGAVATGGCYIGGCSSQICSDQPGAVSTCEYREEYACYRSARCERQASGECGWTETPDLAICLNAVLNPGADLK